MRRSVTNAQNVSKMCVASVPIFGNNLFFENTFHFWKKYLHFWRIWTFLTYLDIFGHFFINIFITFFIFLYIITFLLHFTFTLHFDIFGNIYIQHPSICSVQFIQFMNSLALVHTRDVNFRAACTALVRAADLRTGSSRRRPSSAESMPASD